MACDANKLKVALFEQTKEVREFVDESIKTSDTAALRLVKDKGYAEPNDNNDVVIFGSARQASIAYRNTNNSVRSLLDAQTMPGRGLDGSNTDFDTDNNDLDDNACHGQCRIDFAQGFRRIGTVDQEIAVSSQVICTKELNRMDRAMVKGFFRSLRENFQRWGMENFNDELINKLILYSEANVSILAADRFDMTTGGFSAPPVYRATIAALQEWARRLWFKEYAKGWNPSVDALFDVEMPRQDWIDAVKADQLARNPTGTVYEIKYLEDAEGPMRGRKYDTYGGIRCYFNEMPIRGYFVQTSAPASVPNYSFVRIYPWKNVSGEIGGLVLGDNPQYSEDAVRVDGNVYNVVTLIPHIHPRSFQRYGLVKPAKPIGHENASTNFEMDVLDGAYIPCNDYDDKFKLVARHAYRWRALHPEVSGFMAVRHSLRTIYTLAATPRNMDAESATITARGQILPACGPDDCSTLTCGQCGQVANDALACVDENAAPAGTLNLVPAGAVATTHFGVPYNQTFKVYRSGDPSSYASTNYATANGTASAGTSYTATSGTLEWDPGDTAPKTITVPQLGAGSGTYTLTLSGATGDSLGTNTVATVTITNGS